MAISSIEIELDKVENFIESLSLPERIAKGCLFSEKCCKAFYTSFYGRNRYVVDDLLDYREKMISQSKITLDLFLDMCYNGDKRVAFERTFYQSFTTKEMLVIDRAIDSGKASLQSIYTDFKKNPEKNILKNVI